MNTNKIATKKTNLTKQQKLEFSLKYAIRAGNKAKAAWLIVQLKRLELEENTVEIKPQKQKTEIKEIKEITPLELACFRSEAEKLEVSLKHENSVSSFCKKNIHINHSQWNIAALYAEGKGLYHNGKCLGAFLVEESQGLMEVIYLVVTPSFLAGKMGIKGYQNIDVDVFGTMINHIKNRAKFTESTIVYDCWEEDQPALQEQEFSKKDEVMIWKPLLVNRPILELVA